MLFCFLFFLWENERRKTKKNEGKESSGHAPWKRFHSSFIFQRFIHPFFLVSIALNVGHTHTQIRRKSRTGHIYTISFCLDWLVPLQSTHWSNSLVDAWSLDPTLQWPLFILLFFSFHAVVVICIIELRRTDGRVIRNETTCNYRRDWRSYPYFFSLFIIYFPGKETGGSSVATKTEESAVTEERIAHILHEASAALRAQQVDDSGSDESKPPSQTQV